MLKVSKQQIENFLRDENLGPWVYKEEKGEFLINSPFTSDSKKKCGINTKKNGIWNDYKTGFGGSWWKFVKEVKKLDTINAATFFFLKKYYSIEDLRGVSLVENVPEIKDNPNDICLPEDAEPLSNQIEFVSYLRSRFFTDEMLGEIKIFISRAEKRIIFPTYEAEKLTFFARRSIDKWNPIRWLNSDGQGANPVWNLDNISSTVYVFEGIFDAIRVWPRGVAVFGNTARPKQIEKILSKSPNKVVIVMDGDSPGRNGQKRTANRFAELHNNVWIHLWDKKGPKDFGEMTEVKLNEIRWNTTGKLLWEMNEK